MATNSKSLWGIGSEIKALARGGKSTDDDRLDIRLVFEWITQGRATVITQMAQAKEGDGLPTDLFQQFCLKLENVDKSECPCIKWGCNIMKAKLPKSLSVGNDPLIPYVGLVDGQSPFNLVKPADLRGRRSGRYSTNEYFYYIIGDYIYVDRPADSLVCEIFVRSILADPRDEANVYVDGAKSCFDIWSEDYPITPDMRAMIVEWVQRQRIYPFVNGLRSFSDLRNDTRDSATPKDPSPQPEQ